MRSLILKAGLALALGAGVVAVIPASAEALSCTSGYAHIFNHNNLNLDNNSGTVIGEFADLAHLTNYCYENGWIVQADTNLCVNWASSSDIDETTCNTSNPKQVWTRYGTPWSGYYRLENLFSKTCLSGNGLVRPVITASCTNTYAKVWTS